MVDRPADEIAAARELERLRARVAELEALERRRQHTETELRESEQQYRAIVEDQTEFVVRHAPGGMLTFVNEALSRYVGQSPEELIGTNVFSYVIEAEHEKLREHLAALSPEDPVGTLDQRVRLPSGVLRWHRWTNRAIFDQSGAPVEFQSVGRDITEEVLAKEALIQSKERLRNFVDSATDSFVLCDANLNVTDLNSEALREMGLADKAAIIGRPLPEFVPSISQSGRIEQYRAVVQTGVPVFVEDVCPGDQFGDLHFSVRAFKMGNGVGFVVRNTSDRVLVARQLQESESRYRALFEHVPVGLYRSTPTGRILNVNSALVEMLGYPDRETLLTVNAATLYEDADSRRALLERIEQDNVAYALEFQLRRHDGTPIWVRENARVVRDREGAVQCYEGSLEDITDRKATEASLRETTTTLDNILKSTTEYAIAATDLDLRIVHCNPAVERVFGLPLDQVLGLRVEELHRKAGVVHERVARALAIAESEGRWETELRMPGPGNQTRIVHPVVMPMRDEVGTATGYVVLARDVTRERQAEEARDRLESQLRHVHKLQAIGQLAAGVAHDFNSVLMIILGNAELLQAAVGRPPSERSHDRYREQLGQILTAVERGPHVGAETAGVWPGPIVEAAVGRSERAGRAHASHAGGSGRVEGGIPPGIGI